MKRNILLITFLTILGSLGQGKPVDKKKQKDKPGMGYHSLQSIRHSSGA